MYDRYANSGQKFPSQYKARLTYKTIHVQCILTGLLSEQSYKGHVIVHKVLLLQWNKSSSLEHHVAQRLLFYFPILFLPTWLLYYTKENAMGSQRQNWNCQCNIKASGEIQPIWTQATSPSVIFPVLPMFVRVMRSKFVKMLALSGEVNRLLTSYNERRPCCPCASALLCMLPLLRLSFPGCSRCWPNCPRLKYPPVYTKMTGPGW